MVPLWHESWSSQVFSQVKGLGSRPPSVVMPCGSISGLSKSTDLHICDIHVQSQEVLWTLPFLGRRMHIRALMPHVSEITCPVEPPRTSTLVVFSKVEVHLHSYKILCRCSYFNIPFLQMIISKVEMEAPGFEPSFYSIGCVIDWHTLDRLATTARLKIIVFK